MQFRSWNSVGVDFCSTLSIAIFKKNVVNLIRPKPRSIFGISDSMGIKFIIKLRLGLSPLKFHKRKHNFLDTPDDSCDCRRACEDTAHFLFTCDIHNVARLSLRTAVMDILLPNKLQHLISNTDLYLYGHSSLSFIENKNIVLSTISSIKESKKFSWQGWNSFGHQYTRFFLPYPPFFSPIWLHTWFIIVYVSFFILSVVAHWVWLKIVAVLVGLYCVNVCRYVCNFLIA